MHIRSIVQAMVMAPLATLSLAAQQDSVAVEVEVVIAASIVDREPIGGGTLFPADVGRVAGWTRVTGAANTTIEHVWRHDDLEFVVPLNIGGSPWRTWSTKTIPSEWVGEWTLEVRDANGDVISTTTFTVGG